MSAGNFAFLRFLYLKFSERPILSRIFKEVIPEFQAVSLKEIEEQYIGDDIWIGTVPVGCLEPDGTEVTNRITN